MSFFATPHLSFLPLIVTFIRFQCKAILFLFLHAIFSLVLPRLVLLRAFDNLLAHDDNLFNLKVYAIQSPILHQLTGVSAVQTKQRGVVRSEWCMQQYPPDT